VTDQTIFPHLGRLPEAADAARAATGIHQLLDALAVAEPSTEVNLVRDSAGTDRGRRLLESVFGNSPFLGRIIIVEPGFFGSVLQRGPDLVVGDLMADLKDQFSTCDDYAALKKGLRVARRRLALTVALADLGGLWSLEQVTAALSDFARLACTLALDHLVRQLGQSGDLDLDAAATPQMASGLCVLALGKLGAGELNYSSDIDLIVLYDADRARFRGRRSLQDCYVRLVRRFVDILQEPTADGYVFRVDLRLRPDPSSMPLAVSMTAAETYYESIGQTWERSAMIKARPIAGDITAGLAFLDDIRPFIWRRHLDFAAIEDVHAMKRAIHAHKGGRMIAVEGHNIKIGRGGIREIEFFAQTQQLIWGGREPALRTSSTVGALEALCAAGRIGTAARDELTCAYRFLRTLEHRLQMIDDLQTHTLPQSAAGIAHIAAFLGYPDAGAFRQALLGHLGRVEHHYAHLFEETPGERGETLDLSGAADDTGASDRLQSYGYADGAWVRGVANGWLAGRYRATRSERSRRILRDILPDLLKALAGTAMPDQALAKLDEFLARLPAGVQLFSLLQANPVLLELLAQIMGEAPVLADHLSRNPNLLDAVLTSGFFDPIPPADVLADELAAALAQARDFEDVLDISRRWTNDRKFLVGVQILRAAAEGDAAGSALSDIADTAIRSLLGPVETEFAERHGRVPGGGLAVVAMGKLGSREMSVGSDLDLLFIYETPDGVEGSDGDRSLAPSHYFTRLSQRLINAITAPTAEGKLYEVDMRLRPLGSSGPLATSLAGFRAYHVADAWTWERMALTRARVIAGPTPLAARVDAAIRDVLTVEREDIELVVGVAEMRERIAEQHGTDARWDAKHRRGALVDCEFIVQYLLLRTAPAHPDVLTPTTTEALSRLESAGALDAKRAAGLADAIRLWQRIQGFLRITTGRDFDEATAPEGLKAALARAAGAESFAALCATVDETARFVRACYGDIVEAPAIAAGWKPRSDAKGGRRETESGS
jgi:glutamate-ammonia-ligase adenylyltransferase